MIGHFYGGELYQLDNPKKDHLFICGLGPGWSTCPPRGCGVDIWGVNNILNRRPVDVVFEIHDFHEKLNRLRGSYVHRQAIRQAQEWNVPYVVREYWDFLPHLHQIIYPREEVFEELQTDFIGCTLDSMIALAVACGYQKIDVFGSGANFASLYDYQVPSNNFWIGYCLGRGIKIKFHHAGGLRHSDILSTHNGLVYGFNIPQRRWSYFDPTLPRCDCNKRNEAPCTDF